MRVRHKPARGVESQLAIKLHHLDDGVRAQHFDRVRGLQGEHSVAGFDQDVCHIGQV